MAQQTEAELEAAVQAGLEAASHQNVADFKPRAKSGSVAEQMLGIAETIKAVHQEIDKLEADVIARLGVIRKTLGGRG